jgi:DNA primase
MLKTCISRPATNYYPGLLSMELEQLKQIPIVNVADALGIVIKGKKALCFNGHDKKTLSLSFDSKKNIWRCYGCGAYGDNINLVQSAMGYDFKTACAWLANHFGFASSDIRYKTKKRLVIGQHKSTHRCSENKPDPEVYEWLINSCTLSKPGYNYLANVRKFNETTIKHFNIKDIEKPSDVFIEAKKEWGIERLAHCGLAKETDRTIYKFVWWSHVILFPFYNLQGKITYLQGRQLGDKEPRYINLNGIKTEIFHMNVLNDLDHNDVIFICEGLTDVLSAFQAKLNAVGIIGAHGFKEEWAQRFMNFRIIIIPDADNAGNKFAESIEFAFRKIGKSIQVIKLPDGMDLSDLTQSMN